MRKPILKKLLITSLLLVFTVIFVIYDGMNGNFARDYFMEKQTKAYLLKQGFSEEEIVSIEASYDMKVSTNHMKGTIALVTFIDDPKEQYVYLQKRGTDEIVQDCTHFSYKNEKRKHTETNCY